MKRQLRSVLHGLFYIALMGLSACQDKADTSATGPDRPHQPWIFRSVLDEQPRIITLALHDNLWASYHTDSCSLYKVWKGHVHFQGAVYDNAHGPQPISIGNGWIVNPHKRPWQVMYNGTNVLQEVRYAGHALRKGKAVLTYNLHCDNHVVIQVEEVPEYAERDKLTGFERVYRLANVPEGYSVQIRQRVASVALANSIQTNGGWEVLSENAEMADGRQLLTLDGMLTLLPGEDTYLRVYFANRPTIANPNKAGEMDEELPLGQRLIAKSDCKTCHNEKVQTIGPAYKAIAERYPWNEETVVALANKVISGGAGIWGIQAMSPHPELPVADAREMVRYILRLDTTDAGQQEGIGLADLRTDIQELKNPLSGLVAEVWTNQKGHRKLPAIPLALPSDQAGVVVDLYNLDATNFGGLTEDFVMVAKGYLFAEADMTVGLRILSDDGSKVILDGSLILDNDGLHGTEMKQIQVKLNKGYHPITIEYMNGKGGRYLSFEWQKAGETVWTGVPGDVLLHQADDHDKMKGKTLAMAPAQAIPGDKTPLDGVHPSYTLMQARPWDFLPKVGGLDFLSDGTLVVSTWDPAGAVYLLTNADSGDPSTIKVKQIAAGLAEPLGLKVINDTIYVLQKQELTRLIDTDGDGIIDEYQCVNNRWETSANFHEFAFGLAEKNGDLFATLAIAIQPGGASAKNQKTSRGHVVRFDLPSGELHFMASGLRTPNGIGIGTDGELFVADNQGDWLPSSKILHVQEGDFFGSRAVDYDGTAELKEKPPVVWLPQDEIGNSPSTPLALNDGPYKGQMIHGEVTNGGVKRVFVEKINGQYQGALFRFTQGLEAGVNRLAWGPDGGLYIGGIGNPGNWQHTGKLWYGLQRLKYNGDPTFEMLAVRAKSNGLEIEFTEPLRDGDGWNTDDWEVQQWRYVPTADYGGPKVDLKNLKVLSSRVSDDRRKVYLRLDGMKPGHVIYVHMKKSYISASGRQLWSTESWYTMNAIPENDPLADVPARTFSNNTLTSFEERDGWKLLFDGRTTNGWHNFNKSTLGKSWIVEDGALTLNAVRHPDGHWQAPDGGDIVADGEYENFELRLDWKIAPCGNSGIIYNVVESADYNYVWETGPEMQILDNTCHPDSRYPTHRAGDLYDLLECQYVSVRPAGEWNSVRIVKQNGKVEHWLNGIRVVSYEMYTDDWLEMIANSKFRDMPSFGRAQKGKIALQDHGDKVWFRNIKIKAL